MKHEKTPEELVRDTGIRIESTYSVRIKKVNSQRYSLTLLHLLLLITAVLSTVYCLITAMEIQVYHQRLIGLTCIFCIIFWGITLMEKAADTLIPITLFLFVLTINERLDMTLQGFYHLENYAIVAVNSYFNLKLFRYEVASRDGTPEVTFFMLVVTFFLSWLYAYFISSGRNKYLYLVISLAFLIAPCIVGRIPKPLIFMVNTITMFGMYGIFTTKRARRWYKWRSGSSHMRYIGLSIGASCMLLAAISLLVLTRLIPQEAYEQLPIERWRKVIQEEIASFDLKTVPQKLNQLTNTTVSVGGLAGGKLDVNNGQITYTHSKQLIVTMIKPNTGLYLKGYTGVNYTGTAWTEATKEQQEAYQDSLKNIETGSFSSDNFSILNLGCFVNKEMNSNVSVMPSSITLEYKEANKNFLYYPYYTWFGEIQTENEKDYQYHELRSSEAYVFPEDQNKNYTLRYYNAYLPENDLYQIMRITSKLQTQSVDAIVFDDTMEQVLQDFKKHSKMEEEYREYVYHTYLSLPETGLEKLIEEFNSYKDHINGNAYMLQNGIDVLQAIEFVRNYLWQNADYTLSPGKTPAGQDYIEYFIYTNHKGYCAHYASAATIILRALGIPARYVEGYYIDEAAIEAAAVISGDGKEALGADEVTDISLSYGADVFAEGEVSKQVRPEIKLTVEDTQAHSWVEIYLDGFGWYPVEFTEADSSANQAITASPTVTQAPTATPTEGVKEQDQTQESEQEEKPEEDEEVQPTQPENSASPTEEQGAAGGGSITESKSRINLSLIRWGLGIATVLGLIWGFHRYRWGIWGKYFSKYDTSHLYRSWYQQLEKLRKKSISMEELNHQLTLEEWQQMRDDFYGVEFEICNRLRKYYLKAVYSKERLDEMEFKEARELLEQMYRAVYLRKPRLVQLWYRYYVILRFE